MRCGDLVPRGRAPTKGPAQYSAVTQYSTAQRRGAMKRDAIGMHANTERQRERKKEGSGTWLGEKKEKKKRRDKGKDRERTKEQEKREKERGGWE